MLHRSGLCFYEQVDYDWYISWTGVKCVLYFWATHVCGILYTEYPVAEIHIELVIAQYPSDY